MSTVDVPALVEKLSLVEMRAIMDGFKARLRDAALKCPNGGRHVWTYSRPNYTCDNCGFHISKTELKEATD